MVSALGGVIGIALGLSIGGLAQAFGVPVSFAPGPVVLAFGSAFLTASSSATSPPATPRGCSRPSPCLST